MGARSACCTVCSSEDAVKLSGMDAVELQKIAEQQKQGKRQSICAESLQQTQVDNFVKPVHKKSDAEVEELLTIIGENEKMQVLMGGMPQSAFQDIINAFYPKSVRQGDVVIKQGEEGDSLYICTSGNLDIFVARPGADGKFQDGDVGGKVLSVGRGALFGELALMYSAPRAATVVVTSPSAQLWALDRLAFKCLVQRNGENQYIMYEGWLRDLELLKPFNHHELSQLADVMESELFDTDENIIKQGDTGYYCYLVEDGTCSAYIAGEDGEKEVKQYKPGDYFGEIALITKQPRAATVRATGEGCTVLSISKDAFENILGPIKDQLIRDIAKYPKYADLIKQAS